MEVAGRCSLGDHVTGTVRIRLGEPCGPGVPDVPSGPDVPGGPGEPGGPDVPGGPGGSAP